MSCPKSGGPAKRQAQVAVAAGLLLIAACLLGWGMWPAARETRTLSLDLIHTEAAGLLVGAATPYSDPRQAAYAITFNYPRLIRVGDSELVRIRLAPAAPLPEGQPSAAEEGHREPGPRSGDRAPVEIAIQARLEVSGAIVNPKGDITTPWSAAEGASFVWTIRIMTAPTARGTAWMFLIPVGSTDLAAERIAISAQPVEIAAGTLLGVNGPVARLSGSLLMVLGTILGLAGIAQMPRQEISRRREHAR